jgi:hypothetical protein
MAREMLTLVDANPDHESMIDDAIPMYSSVCHRCKTEDDDCATILCPRCGQPTVWQPTLRPRDFFDKSTSVVERPIVSNRRVMFAEGTRDLRPAPPPELTDDPDALVDGVPQLEILAPIERRQGGRSIGALVFTASVLASIVVVLAFLLAVTG